MQAWQADDDDDDDEGVTILSLASLTVDIFFFAKFAISVNFANLSETYVAAEHITFDIPLITVTQATMGSSVLRGGSRGFRTGLPPFCQRLRVTPNECTFFI